VDLQKKRQKVLLLFQQHRSFEISRCFGIFVCFDIYTPLRCLTCLCQNSQPRYSILDTSNDKGKQDTPDDKPHTALNASTLFTVSQSESGPGQDVCFMFHIAWHI
jgi:hypothetical protein